MTIDLSLVVGQLYRMAVTGLCVMRRHYTDLLIYGQYTVLIPLYIVSIIYSNNVSTIFTYFLI